MESKALLTLDRRSQRKDLTYPICLALYHKGSKSYINLREYVLDDFWDQANGKVLKGAEVFPTLSWVNNKISGKKIDANRIIKSLEETGQLSILTHGQLKDRIENKSSQASFSKYLNDLISEYKKNGNDGQVFIHNGVKAFLIKYADGDRDYKFDEINFKMLRSIEGKFKPRIPGNKNGLAVQFRAIRSIWNKAIKEGIVKPDGYPFKDYRIKSSKTHKSAIRQEDLKKIRELSLPLNTHAWHCRNMFFFSFYTMGMNFSDISQLRVKHIRDGRVTYLRSKTKKPISIKLTDNINEILNLYLDEKGPNAYIFPVVTDTLKANDQIKAYRSVANHALKRWAKRLTIDKSLSFNTARHSWATIGKFMNIPIAVISEGLGHADISTTQIYLDSFETDVMDNANAMITF